MVATNNKYRNIPQTTRKNETRGCEHFVVVQLKYEYQNYTDEYGYCIYTRLSEECFLNTYGEEAKKYEPYIILNWELYEVRADYIRNEEKFKKRRQRTEGRYGYEDGTSECVHRELQISDVEEKVIVRIENQRLMKALDQLTPTQKRRVTAYFIEGKSSRAIAAEEGVNYSKVDNSIKAALKKLKEILA